MLVFLVAALPRCVLYSKVVWPRLSFAPFASFAVKEFLRELRRFDQLHLAVFLAVQDFYPAFHVAEDEDFAIAELGLFYRFFQAERFVRHRIGALDDMGLGKFDYVWE